MLNPWIKIKYFTFQEVLNLYPSKAPDHPHSKNFASDWFSQFLSNYDLELAVNGVSQYISNDLIKDIVDALMTIVYQRHSEDYIYHVELALHEDYELQDAEFYKYVQTLINVIDLTIPRYIPLLQAQEFYSVDPVAPLKSVSKGRTRYNDTPQSMGIWDDEEHASNLSNSESETEVDSGSIVSRLDEAYKNWRSIILEWANEFNQCFIKEEQVK